MVQLAYAIGVAEPVSVYVTTYRHRLLDEEKLSKLVRKHFDLTPKGIIASLDLLKPIYRQTARLRPLRQQHPQQELGTSRQSRRLSRSRRGQSQAAQEISTAAASKLPRTSRGLFFLRRGAPEIRCQTPRFC